MATALLMIGARSAAIDAALNLDCQIYLIADLKTPKRLLKKCVASQLISLPSDQPTIVLTASSLFPNRCPDAVIAVSEQAVLAAAWCRQHWQLAGLQPEDAKAALIKSLMKQRFIQHQIPCWPTFAVETADEACEIANSLGYPLVVKALASSGSRGFRIIRDRARLRRVVKNMLEIPAYGGIGIEKLVEANEFSLEVLVRKGKLLFSNFTRYQVPGAMNLVPANLPNQLQKDALLMAKKVLKAFNFGFGMAHIEFYYQNEQLWLGEINARPPGGGLMELISLAYQFDAWQAVISCELNCSFSSINSEAQRIAANWMIHPGGGKVTSIEGADLLAAHPLCHEFKLKLVNGQNITKRSGTGETVGHLTLHGDSYSQLVEALLWAKDNLRIELD